MIPHRVRLALCIAFLCHGLFILTARYRLSYDAYTHMLFANHYAENWFSLWETRWYTGFTVVSYPPLIHQIIALFIPILGFDRAFAVILWTVTTLYPLGIYAFSRIFMGKSAASYAALASAILLPIYVVAHIFGQLPFLAGTLLSLFGAASLDRYLRQGGIHNLLLTVCLITTTMAAHHATLLLQPFLVFAVLFNRGIRFALRARAPTATAMDVGVRPRDLQMDVGPSLVSMSPSSLLLRFALFLIPTMIASIIVIWPFWQWGLHQTMQTPIDHPSRHNFFSDPLAHAIFFWPLYGPLVVIIPLLFSKWTLRFLGLIISFIILFLLGLGGTTALPRLLFGDAWEWLTYDRFAFWACLTLTPFFGILFIRLKRRMKGHIMAGQMPVTFRRNIFSALTLSIFAVTSLGAWLTPLFFPVQPESIDMQPIITFLKNGDRSQWRYLTFGFGDQFAYLNLLTKATTIDGSYHTARTLPELRESGIGQVDTVYWALKGIPAIRPILQNSGEHGVRWGFVNRRDFVPELKKNGWIFVKYLRNGIQVWENPEATLPEPSEPSFMPAITSFSWGMFPMLAFITTVALGTLRIWPIHAEQVLRSIHAFVVGLIPLSLCFWYYHTVEEFPHSRVYFTYSSALFFLSDALVVLAVILWLSAKIAHPTQITITRQKLHALFSDLRLPLFAIFLLSCFSVAWSSDWRTSLYIAVHFWLIFLLILSLHDWRDAWKPVIFGLCAALSIQLIAGFAGFTLQSTAFLNPLQLNWPGMLDLSMPGISAVHLSDGSRVMRPYGTLPHPNILGGFTLVSLLGPASLFLVNERPNYPALMLFALGISLFALTFSRSAWLGLMAFLFVLILKSKNLNRKRAVFLAMIAAISFAITLYPYRQLVQARTVNITSNSEKFSFTGRMWLNQEAMQMISEHPVAGAGVGSFIIELSQRAGEGYIIEPVHNLPLLVGAELGSVGLIVLTGLFVSIVLNIFQTQTWEAILAGAIIAGLGIISLFDHYLWSLAPGRLIVGLALGLLTGQRTRPLN